MWVVLHLIGGGVALYLGAEWLVRGSASLARRFGLSPLTVGLTVVAYGTSAPELIVSSVAALQGQGGLALGNAVGSNIFNLGLVLGLTAVITPLRVQSQLIKFDAPVMAGVAVVFLLMFCDRAIELWEALLLLSASVVYTAVHVRLARGEIGASVGRLYDSAVPEAKGSWIADAGFVLTGFVALGVGSHFFVAGAVSLARLWGVSEAVIGLTLVAAGTGLPELAASVVAACRRQTEIALGNIVGSNIYNLLAIVGAAGTLAGGLEGLGLELLEVGVLVGISMLILPLLWTGATLRRWEGCLLLAGYGGYLVHLLSSRAGG